MRRKENVGRIPVERDFANPDPEGLIGITPPNRASRLFPWGRVDRQYRRSLRTRLAAEIAHHDTIRRKIEHQEEIHLVGPFESIQTNLFGTGIREAEFWAAIGDFITENTAGEKASLMPLNILVISDNASQDMHDTELPFEMGQHGNIDFLGPLYGQRERNLCTSTYSTYRRTFSEVTSATLMQRFAKGKEGYDLIAIHNGNSLGDLYLETADYANFLLDLLNPDGRIVLSGVPSTGPLGAAFLAQEESAGLDIQQYGSPLFINMANPHVAYVPSPDDESQHRAVLSIGRKPLEDSDITAKNAGEPLPDTGDVPLVRRESSPNGTAETDEPATDTPLTDAHTRLPRSRRILIGGAVAVVLGTAAAAAYAETSSPAGPSCPAGTEILPSVSGPNGSTAFTVDGKPVKVRIAGDREIVTTPQWPNSVSMPLQPWGISLGPETVYLYPKNGEVSACAKPEKPNQTPDQTNSSTSNSK